MTEQHVWTPGGHVVLTVSLDQWVKVQTQRPPCSSNTEHWTHSDTSSAAGWCHAFTAGEETSSIIWIICSNTPQSDAHLLKSGVHTWWCRDRWRETTPDLTRLDRDFSDFMSCFLHCWRVWLSPQVLLPSAVWGRKVSTWKWFSFKAAEQEFRADDCAW